MLSQSGSKEKQMLRLSSLFIGPGPHPWDGTTHIQQGSFSKGSLPRSTLIDTPRVCFHGDTEFSSVGLKIYYHSGLGRQGQPREYVRLSGELPCPWVSSSKFIPLCLCFPHFSLFLWFFPHTFQRMGGPCTLGPLFMLLGSEDKDTPRIVVVDVPPVLATSPQPLGHLFSTSYAEGIAPSPC